MATNHVIVDGTTGGTNTRVIRVIPQTTLNSDSTINAAANKGYTLTSSTLQTINLPTPCIPGDVFALHGVGTGLFKIVQQAGEQITLGDTSSTLGVSGFIDSTRTGDDLYLICIDAAGLWKNDGGWGGQLLVDGTTLVDTTNNVGGVPVTLSSTGIGGTDLVTSGTSPALTIARINATTGVSGSFVSGVYKIINTAPDQTVVLTSPGNNIRFSGTYPNLTGDVGTTTAGIGGIVINNFVAGIHGDYVCSFGHEAGLNGQGKQGNAFGNRAAKTNQGITACAFGTDTGNLNQGEDASAFGSGAGGSNQGLRSTCLGALAGAFDALPYSLQIGWNCASVGADGRLGFGSNMEALTATSTATASQSGYMNFEWNGTHYRIPVFSNTSDETLISPTSTNTLTNKTFDANGTGNSLSNVEIEDFADATAGELPTWDAAGAPATVAAGTDGHVLTSNGAGASPSFQSSGVAVRSFGEINKTFADSTEFMVVGVWKIWDSGTFSDGEMSNFTRSTTRLTYTGSTTETFAVCFEMSSDENSVAAFRGGVYKNGILHAPSQFEFTNTAGGGGGAPTLMTSSWTVFLPLSTNDYIEPWVFSDASINLVVQNLKLIAQQIS